MEVFALYSCTYHVQPDPILTTPLVYFRALFASCFGGKMCRKVLQMRSHVVVSLLVKGISRHHTPLHTESKEVHRNSSDLRPSKKEWSVGEVDIREAVASRGREDARTRGCKRSGRRVAHQLPVAL